MIFYIGSLTIYTRDESGKTVQTLFTKNGDQLNEWKTAEVTVSSSTKFQVSYVCLYYLLKTEIVRDDR